MCTSSALSDKCSPLPAYVNDSEDTLAFPDCWLPVLARTLPGCWTLLPFLCPSLCTAHTGSPQPRVRPERSSDHQQVEIHTLLWAAPGRACRQPQMCPAHIAAPQTQCSTARLPPGRCSHLPSGSSAKLDATPQSSALQHNNRSSPSVTGVKGKGGLPTVWRVKVSQDAFYTRGERANILTCKYR